jgi:hypothetical protein
MTPDSGEPVLTAPAATPPASRPDPQPKEESVTAIVVATSLFSLLLVLPFLVWVSGSAATVGDRVGTLVLAIAVGFAGLLGCVVTLLLHLRPSDEPVRWEARWTPLLRAAFAPPFAFTLAILLAARGLMPLAGVWALSLAPSLFLLWRARRAGADEVDAPGQGFPVGVALGLVPVTIVLFTLAVMGLDAESKRGVETPTFGAFLARYHTVMRYADLRTPADPAVDPRTGGEALHSLARMGTAQPILPEKQPPRKYPEVWVTDDGSVVGAIPREWGSKLIPLAARGMSPEQLAYVRRIAAHPAHAEFAVVARAATLDVVDAAIEIPVKPQFQLGSMPLVPRKALIDGGNAHVAAAALDLAEGRTADAEAKLREVYTAGILLLNDSPLFMDAGAGLVLAESGRDGLREFYRATGRAAELARLDQANVTAARYASARSFPAPDDAAAPRAMRWQSVANASMEQCFALRGIVFGPGPDRAEAIAKARASLARTPGEKAWLDLIEDTPRRIARAQASQLGSMQRLSRRIFGNGASTGCPRAIQLDAIAAT